jgi:lipopolysaccharide export LptBFGC system permease protein LptF
VEISFRDLMTLLHGMGFGALFMLAFSGAIGVIYSTASGAKPTTGDQRMFRFYLVSMATLAWLTVLTGAYLVYPWYRAVPPDGVLDLGGYPQRLLLSSPLTAGWHDIGMEWKEHIAWLTPIAMTMVAYVFIRYGPQLARHRQMRNAVLGFTALAFFATAVAGGFGALLNKYAPIRGGGDIVLLREPVK